MSDIIVSTPIDTFMQSTTQTDMRNNLGLGDAATKNTGSTAGTVAAGDAVVLKSGSTMTGRLNLPALAGQAALNLGGTTTVATPATGDVWIAPDSSLKWQNGATTNTALTGTVAIANGGTGQTTANAAANALLPSQAGNSGKVLSTDGTNTSWTTAGGSGTVTSITAGTGLTGGTITASGTVAADFGATTGKVTEGGTTVLKTGDTMSGKLTLPAATTAAAPINIGSSGVQPVTPVTGDVWIRNNLIQYKGSSATVNSVAATAEPNSFSARQTIQVTDNTNPALRVTQLGTGEALRVEDEANPDATAFVVSASGKVGVGVTPDAAVALSVDTSGIKFGDGTVQTTASGGGVAGVSSFSAGTTGLTPATSTTGAVTLAGTLAIANGGTGQTTQQAALNALAGAVTSGQYLRGTGANVTLSAIQAADVPTLNQNTTGTASNVTGTVAIANGGTGQTTANDALNALLPAQASNNTKLLSTDGTNASWTPAFKFSNTKVVGVDAATIQGCIDLVSSPTALTQVQVLIPPGVYNENLTLKPCVSLASTGLNNGQSSIVRIVGTHTLTGGTSPGDNIIQLNGLRMDYQAGTSPTLTISATGTTPLLVYMQDCMIGNSNASTSSVGVLVNQYCSLRCNNVKSVANSTSGSGGTHVEVNGGTFYGDQFSTEYGTLALRLSGTGGALKPYAELKQCSLSCTGSNVVDITSTTALFSAGWTGFTNTATTGNGINIAANSVIGVFNSVFVITAGASNYVVTGSAGGVYYSLNNSYSNSTGVPYETKVNANISQFLYSSSTPNAINALTGDVTASGTGSQAASVVRIQGRNVSSTAPTSGQVLAWNGTAWTPTAAGGSGTVTSVGVSGGTTGLTTSGGPVTSSGTITLAGTLGVANGGTGATTLTGIVKGSGTSALSAAVAGTDYVAPSGSITGTASNVTGTVAIANGGTGATTQSGAANAVLPSQASNSGKFLTTDGSNVSWATAGGGSGIQVNEYSSTTLISKPAGAKKVDVWLCSAGGSGGGGSGGDGTLANRGGGGGGGSGPVATASFLASDLPASFYVVIGAAATPGAGGVGLNNGLSAGNSGASALSTDTNPFSNSFFSSSAASNGGSGGATSGSGGSAGGGTTVGQISSLRGGDGGTTGAVGSNGLDAPLATTISTNSAIFPTFNSGGGGGGALSTTGFKAGGRGGNLTTYDSSTSNKGGLGGSTSGASGSLGFSPYKMRPASGGGGGASSSTGTGGAGGAGGFPGGGGGGGGAGFTNGGAGGVGGNGYAVLTWYF